MQEVNQHVAIVKKRMYTVPCFAGMFGEQVHRLLVILSIILHLIAVIPLSLSQSPLKGLCVSQHIIIHLDHVLSIPGNSYDKHCHHA